MSQKHSQILNPKSLHVADTKAKTGTTCLVKLVCNALALQYPAAGTSNAIAIAAAAGTARTRAGTVRSAETAQNLYI